MQRGLCHSFNLLSRLFYIDRNGYNSIINRALMGMLIDFLDSLHFFEIFDFSFLKRGYS
jgi:hypothetical protein